MMTDEELLKYERLKKMAASFDALLFDVDGTLADNMHAHKAAYVATAKEYGIELDENIVDETAGWPTVAVAKEITNRYNTQFNVVEFANRKSAIFIERFIQDTQPIKYVKQILIDHQGDKKIGLVSGGRRSTLEITLDVIDVKERYQTLVCAGDTEKGKPSAQPFLLAAQNLQIHPSKCLVFEDGDPGVQGAIEAGMGWVRIDQI